MILSADNGTPAQPQLHAMGAARRDPRRGARPVRGASRRSAAALAPGRSVEQEQASKFQKQGRLCGFQSRPVAKGESYEGVSADSSGRRCCHWDRRVADSSGDDDVCSLRAAPKKKGVFKMMDVLMVGTLAVSFGLVWLLIRWCQKQLDDPES